MESKTGPVNTTNHGLDKVTVFCLDNVAPEKSGISKGKHRFPTIHFQGRFVSFRESKPLSVFVTWFLAGGFQYFLFSPLLGEMIQFD